MGAIDRACAWMARHWLVAWCGGAVVAWVVFVWTISAVRRAVFGEGG